MGNGNRPGGRRRVTDGSIKREVGKNNLQKSALRGGREYPIRHCKVTRVDAKRMVVDLKALSGPSIEAKKVPLTFANAGSRHFLGSIPEVGDVCLVGQAPAESGRSKRFVILGWYVPSVDAGYDWLSVRSHSPTELEMTPKNQQVLSGLASERRHKLRQIEAGNVIASSSQGADLLLTESATLVNRRGNEMILRDQDQALVVRSLQQFHAGAGFRTYSGMIQRDANLLPTQLKTTTYDYAADRQVDEERNPLAPAGLDRTALSSQPQVADIFGEDFSSSPHTNPYDVLGRGLFLDAAGNLIVGQSATYGGKPMYRVCTDLKTNGVDSTGVGIFTEYRIEVAHTTDGTLPVTEQTDGLDVDRLLKTTPPAMPGGDGGPGNPQDPNNQSLNSPMVEFVLGTAVGNDPFNDPEGYGIPLVAKGNTVRPYDPAQDQLSDQLAFMVRSRDPEDPTKESFIGLTKGGAWVSNFQGEGSPVIQENLRTGKVSVLGADKDGASQTTTAQGTISMTAARGRPTDNVGVEIQSSEGAVTIFGGGANTSGATDGNENPNAPANMKTALSLKSAKGTLVEAADKITVQGAEIASGAKVIGMTASAALNINSGDTVSMSSKSLGVSISGKSEYSYGGPKEMNPTNGSLRSTTFSGNPGTGCVGGAVDEYSMLFGGREETFRMGKHDTLMNVGSFNVRTMTMGSASMMSPGAGFLVSTGLSALDNKVEAGLASIEVAANAGTAKMSASKGTATVSGTAGTTIKSIARVGLKAAFVNVSAIAATPGGVLTDGCLDSITGRPFLTSGSMGCATFRVG